jgi:hypothetical protein
MEKRGDISHQSTPTDEQKPPAGTPMTKESADRLQQHPVRDLAEAVADCSKPKK